MEPARLGSAYPPLKSHAALRRHLDNRPGILGDGYEWPSASAPTRSEPQRVGDAARRESRSLTETSGGSVLEVTVNVDLDAALMACPFDERLGETLPDACAPIIATDVHASQHTEGHRLASWARLCGVPSDQPDDRVVASSHDDNCGVVCEKPPKVACALSQRSRHVGVGIMHASILREEQSFEFDERFKVTLVGELHNRHPANRSDESDGPRDEFCPSTVISGHSSCAEACGESVDSEWILGRSYRALRPPSTGS